jgi:hypothetical protein
MQSTSTSNVMWQWNAITVLCHYVVVKPRDYRSKTSSSPDCVMIAFARGATATAEITNTPNSAIARIIAIPIVITRF